MCSFQKRVGVVEAIFAVLIRNVGSPQFDRAGAVHFDPVRNGGEDVAAELPGMQVGGAAKLELAAILRSAGGEDVPGIAGFDDGGVVRSPKVAGECERLRGLREYRSGAEHRRQQ